MRVAPGSKFGSMSHLDWKNDLTWKKNHQGDANNMSRFFEDMGDYPETLLAPVSEAPIVGQRYWLRRATKTERQRILAATGESCGFCGLPTPMATYRRLLVECVPIRNPMTACCRQLDEPPPGSFAIWIISGSLALNGQEQWCTPDMAVLLSPAAQDG